MADIFPFSITWKFEAEILLRISREFVKSVEWLLTGEG
jgi:hypothetical protein